MFSPDGLFTFICPTELVGLNDKHGDFADRDCGGSAASTDTVHSHFGWVKADARLWQPQSTRSSPTSRKSIRADYGRASRKRRASRCVAHLPHRSERRAPLVVRERQLGGPQHRGDHPRSRCAADRRSACNWKKGEADAVVARRGGLCKTSLDLPDRCPGIECTIRRGPDVPSLRDGLFAAGGYWVMKFSRRADENAAALPERFSVQVCADGTANPPNRTRWRSPRPGARWRQRHFARGDRLLIRLASGGHRTVSPQRARHWLTAAKVAGKTDEDIEARGSRARVQPTTLLQVSVRCVR